MASIGELNKTPIREFDWRISDFFSLSSEKRYISPEFSFADASWCLVIYANGETSAHKGFISLCLARQSNGPCRTPIEIDYRLGLKTPDGEKHKEQQYREVFDNDILRGNNRFLSGSQIIEKKSEFIPQGVLTVFCTMKHLKSSDDTTPNTSGSDQLHQKSKILQDFKQLFRSQEDCDVVIRVKGQEFPAHRAILKARSPVLACTFRNDMKEKATGTMDIEDCDPSTFSDFLSFLYCEEVGSLSQENVFKLFTAADKYDVLDLKIKCLDFIKANLSIGTFCETITLSLQHSETELTSLSTDFFVKNADEIIRTVKWQTFVDENPVQSNELFMKFVASVKHSTA